MLLGVFEELVEVYLAQRLCDSFRKHKVHLLVVDFPRFFNLSSAVVFLGPKKLLGQKKASLDLVDISGAVDSFIMRLVDF